eukprot:CAMPEP_0185791740 /NCGR_PEP_ID=MMETSP1174-20130828/158548_1 /TAXON_ID=35687 /ORGANISM="Dictyocha speculum, Strain CCMP1381" /LENGTH=86 /DNA_ID=CAMNT_0028486733 /DNA_START=921 /DNA_END=1177 /DNA_ORIENTATION=+
MAVSTLHEYAVPESATAVADYEGEKGSAHQRTSYEEELAAAAAVRVSDCKERADQLPRCQRYCRPVAESDLREDRVDVIKDARLPG